MGRISAAKAVAITVGLFSVLGSSDPAWAQSAFVAQASALRDDEAANRAQQILRDTSIEFYGLNSESNSLPQFSWGIPRSPALTLAGLDPTKVSTSDSLRSFVVSVPTTLNNDEQGQAIALDVSLSQLFQPERSPTALYRYRGENVEGVTGGQRGDTFYQRWLRRSRIGIALYEGVDDDDASKDVPSRLAFGFSTSLWDESDPVMQDGPEGRAFLEECTTSTLLAGFNQTSDGSQLAGLSQGQQAFVTAAAFSQAFGGASTERLTAANFDERVESRAQALTSSQFGRAIFLEATKDCAQRASEIAELRRDLDVGFGVLYRGEPGQLSEFEDRGAAAWIAFRFPWGVDPVRPDFGARLVNRESGNANSTDPMANVNSYWLVAGSARISQDEFIATGNDATPEIQVDQTEAWIGFERYSQRFRFGAFYGYSEVEAVEPAGEPFERSGERYVISAQYRLGDEDDSGLWIGLTYGDTGNAANADNDDALMFSINFAPQPAYTINWND